MVKYSPLAGSNDLEGHLAAPWRPGQARFPPGVGRLQGMSTGLRTMTDWLLVHGIEAAAVQGSDIPCEVPYAASEEAGILSPLRHAQKVNSREIPNA